jgi:hypothetical protein
VRGTPDEEEELIQSSGAFPAAKLSCRVADLWFFLNGFLFLKLLRVRIKGSAILAISGFTKRATRIVAKA